MKYINTTEATLVQLAKGKLVSTSDQPVSVEFVDQYGEVLFVQTYPLGVSKPLDMRSALPDARLVVIKGGSLVGHGWTTSQRHDGHFATSANPAYEGKPVDPAVAALRAEFMALTGEVRRLRAQPANRQPRQSVNRQKQKKEQADHGEGEAIAETQKPSGEGEAEKESTAQGES